MQRQKIEVVAVSAVAITLVLGYVIVDESSGSSDSLEDLLESQGLMYEGNSSYGVQESRSTEIAGVSVREATGISGNSEIQVQVFSDVSREFASNYMEDKRKELSSLYTDTAAPYEGVPGREVNCPERFVPELGENITVSEGTSYILYADDEKNIGVCSNSTVNYITKVSINYCSGSDLLVEARFFKPVEEKITESVICS